MAMKSRVPSAGKGFSFLWFSGVRYDGDMIDIFQRVNIRRRPFVASKGICVWYNASSVHPIDLLNEGSEINGGIVDVT